jgi:hypothetical protein
MIPTRENRSIRRNIYCIVTFSTTVLSADLRSTLGLRSERPPEPVSLHGMEIILKINFINNKAIQQVYNFKYLGYTNILMTIIFGKHQQT